MRLKAEHVGLYRHGYPTDVYWSTERNRFGTGKIVGTHP